MPTVAVQLQQQTSTIPESATSSSMQQHTTMSQPAPQQQQAQPQPQLRRAVYIHVSDLTSAYNIDHAKLEEELNRVKAEREKPPEAAGDRGLGGVPTELDTGASQRRLQPPRAGYNLCVLVGKVNVVVDKKRVDGTRVRLAEVEVGDETGTVSLRARDDQIDTLLGVSERSGAAVLRNCTLELYQGKHLRVAVTKWGKLSVYPDQIASTPPPPSKMNRDRNFSLIDLSLVASEMVAPPEAAETENQANSMANANRQQYHSSSSHSRGRGRRGGPSPHSTKGGQAASSHFDPGLSTPMNYQQPGMHGYSGISASHYSFAPSSRQQDKVPTTQQMMFHQQHQQRQYGQPHDMQHQLQTGPLLSPGVALPSATSFETPYNATVPDPSSLNLPASNPFLQHSTSDSPKMNPQAATFDPSRNQFHG